jgi:hypothetical protein
MANLRFLLAALFCLLVSVDQAIAEGTGALAKQSQNPIANLISVPFQNNTNFNVGRLDNDQDILNIQPVLLQGRQYSWRLPLGWAITLNPAC